MTTFDVIVLGGGIVGASTAYALGQRGQNVLLLDQFEPNHKNGSSHGDGRVVRFNYAESIYVEMAMLAYPAWEKLSKVAGIPLIQTTGLIEYGSADCVPIQESEAQLKKYNLAYEKPTVAEANIRFPQFKFAENSSIIYQPEGAVAFADKAVSALWRLFREGGGTTVTGKRIAGIAVTDDAVTLSTTDNDTYTGAKLVMAAGGWTQQLLAQTDLNLPLEVTQEVLSYFPPKDESVNHRVGTMPVMLDYTDHVDDAFYSLPIVEVGGVKIGWHHTGVPMQADDERVVPESLLAGVRDWIKRLFPHLETEPIAISTCLYTNTPDYHFILDKHPQHDNVIIGAGFSGHGFKFGPILGEILAGLALDEEPLVPLDTFAIARFGDETKIKRRVGA